MRLRPRLEVHEDHQRVRARLWCSPIMLSIWSARRHAKSERAMAVSNWGLEVFRWVRGGGTDLMAGTGHVAAGFVAKRQRLRLSHPPRADMPPGRHGPHDRPFGPAQTCAGSDGRCLRRCGRRKAELARRHAGARSNVRSLTGDRQGYGLLQNQKGGPHLFSKSDLLLYTYETKPELLRSYEIWAR